MGLLLLLAALSGCTPSGQESNAGLSLVEIGERSLEAAEHEESQGNIGGANDSYRRSLWAFRYHEKLTGEQPLLLEEAQEGLGRTGGKPERRTP